MVTKAAPKPAAPKGGKAPAKADSKKVRAVNRLYKDLPGGVGVSKDLLWLMTKNNASFLVKQPNVPVTFSRDPLNPKGIHRYRFNGLVNDKIMNVVPANLKKDQTCGVTFVYRKKKDQIYPAKSLERVTLTHPPRKTLETIKRIINSMGYRRDLSGAVLRKASAIIRGQTTKPPKHPERIKKSRPLYIIPRGPRRRGAETRLKRAKKLLKKRAEAKKVLEAAKAKGIEGLKAIKPGKNTVLARKRRQAIRRLLVQQALAKAKAKRAELKAARAKGPDAVAQLLKKFKQERKQNREAKRKAREARQKKLDEMRKKGIAVRRRAPKVVFRTVDPRNRTRQTLYSWETTRAAKLLHRRQLRAAKRFRSLPKEKQEAIKKRKLEKRIKEAERLKKIMQKIHKTRRNLRRKQVKKSAKKTQEAAAQVKKSSKKSKKAAPAAAPAETPMETA